MSTETTAPTTTETEHVTGLAMPFQAAGQGRKRAAPVTEPARAGKVWATVAGTWDVRVAGRSGLDGCARRPRRSRALI